MKKLLATFALLSKSIAITLTAPLFPERALTQNQPSNFPPFDGRPLTGASQQEIGQAAIGFTLASGEFTVLSGSPEVVHTQRITAADYPTLDLGEVNFQGEEPPLVLVVLKGDFDTTNFDSFDSLPESSSSRIKRKYIAYVFDLFAGAPTLIASGLTGEYFRRVLKDSSIPDEPKELIGPEPGMPEPIPEPVAQPTQKLPYGTVIRGEPQAPSFTEKAFQVIVLTTKEAERLGTTHPGTEHLLLALIEEGTGTAAKVLNSLGVTLERARIEVEKVVDLKPKVGIDDFDDEDFESGPYTYEPSAEASLSQAKEEARQLGSDFVGTEHLLLGLIQDEESVAAKVLANMGVELSQIRTEVRHRLT